MKNRDVITTGFKSSLKRRKADNPGKKIPRESPVKFLFSACFRIIFRDSYKKEIQSNEKKNSNARSMQQR